MESAFGIVMSPAEDRSPVSRWILLLVVSLVAAIWWVMSGAMLDRAGAGLPPLPSGARAAGLGMGLVMRLATTAVETGFYAAWWRLRSGRLPFLEAFAALLAVSLCDAVAVGLQWWGEDHGASPTLVAVLAGVRLLDPEAGAAARSFGAFGLLVALRLLLTAWVQGRALRRGLAEPLALTAVGWLACRTLWWWSGDLFQGMSPGGAS